VLPLVGDLILGEAGVDRAGLDAGVAVDALLGIDVELVGLCVAGLIRSGMDAVDRADLDARVVLDPDAWFSDDVGHAGSFGFPNFPSVSSKIHQRYFYEAVYEKLWPVPPLVRDGPDDVLSQPTRARLFARLSHLGRPAGTDELAAELALHPSGVRVHLERLEGAGLVARDRMPQLRGRPRDVWSVAPDALPAGQPPDAYQQLARWLAWSTPARPGRLREIERAGRELGRELPVGQAGSRAEEALGRALAALGFAPQRERPTVGRIVYRLRNCPYREAVHANQPVVCALHRGLTRGLLDELQPSARLMRFVPEDPDEAGCVIEVEGLEAERRS
jgi:predicted ArsR family transcriptional regulator